MSYFGFLLVGCALVQAKPPEALSMRVAHRVFRPEVDFVGQLKANKANEKQRMLQSGTDGGESVMCDAALGQCMGNPKCLDCFSYLSAGGIDWASIPNDVTCRAALDFMYKGGHCEDMSVSSEGESAFCVAFDACVKPQRSKQQQQKNATKIDCSKLESCDWDGFHKQFLGDGICHDSLPGCYNTAVCGWDMGDCCKDTCLDPSDAVQSCGIEGFACRDPQSPECNPSLSVECEGADDDFVFPDEFCEDDQETSYQLVMYDSFGDGWEETTITITDVNNPKTVFSGSLENGFMGTSYVCLSSASACYSVVTKGGMWGKEASWEVKAGTQEGSPSIASGGAPQNCQFAVAGKSCDNTCQGKTDEDPTNDPDYKEFKLLYQCIEKKCPIQMEACNSDLTCNECFEAEDIIPQYCFGVDIFNSLVDCSLCSCTDDARSDFCLNRDEDGNNRSPDEFPFCSSSQIVQGGDALIEFSNCTQFDEVAMLMIDFDQDHFGDLDTFEACAHAYRRSEDHGGYTALGCMEILVKAMNEETQAKKVDPQTSDAVSALAKFLYENGEGFCDCAFKANDDCPLCASFMNFKTLLYETVDACISLDEIDCDAWTEFYGGCRDNLVKEFTNVDFNNAKQCDFVHDGCGGAGPFPSFRRLDCEINKEVTTESWTFYKSFADACLGNVSPAPPPTPQPTPPTGATPQTPAPVPFSPTDGGASPGRKPYLPPEKRDKDKQDKDKQDTPQPNPDSNSEDNVEPADKKGKQSHFWRNLFLVALLGGGGYLYFKRYGLSLEGVQDMINWCARMFRRGRYGSDDAAMYSGLAMSMESSTSFEPASLPPPPSAVDSNYYI